MFPPIGEIVDTGIEHGMGNVGGEGGIVEDMWLEVVKCVGTSQCSKQVVLFPSCVPVEFFEVHQVLGKVCHSFMGPAELPHFSSERCVSFAIKSEINHGQEGFIWVEGISLLLCEYSTGVGVWLGTKWSRVLGAIAPMGEYDLQIIRSKVVAEEGGDDFSTCHPWYDVVDQGFHPLHVPNPLFARDDSWLGYFFWGRRSRSVVASCLFVFFVGGWRRPRIDWVRCAGSWG